MAVKHLVRATFSCQRLFLHRLFEANVGRRFSWLQACFVLPSLAATVVEKKCKEVGGEVCFVSRLADKMHQVT